MVLKIGKAHLDQIRRHAERSYPHECCGVLVGQCGASGERTVRDVVRCHNACGETAGRRYRIAPAALIDAQRGAREAGLSIVGFYHSHPDWPARWSETDLAEAHWSGCSYLIAGVEQGRASETNSFELRESGGERHFEEEPIEVYEDRDL